MNDLDVAILILLGFVILAYGLTRLIEKLGQLHLKKWEKELDSLKSGDSILISHSYFDNEAVFVARIGNNISITPFLSGIYHSTVIIHQDQFIKKVCVKDTNC